MKTNITDKPTADCVPSGSMCLKHKQQLAECWQQSQSNLCSACKEWHTKDYNCKKVN